MFEKQYARACAVYISQSTIFDRSLDMGITERNMYLHLKRSMVNTMNMLIPIMWQVENLYPMWWTRPTHSMAFIDCTFCGFTYWTSFSLPRPWLYLPDFLFHCHACSVTYRTFYFIATSVILLIERRCP